jgi:hypothetical protein
MAGAEVAGAAVAGAENAGVAYMGASAAGTEDALGIAAAPQADVTISTSAKAKGVAIRLVDISLLLEKNIKVGFTALLSKPSDIF